MNQLSSRRIDEVFHLMGERMELESVEPLGIVVCGGAALIVRSLVARTTRDVDVIAMMNPASDLMSPDPLPATLVDIAARVAKDLDLPKMWLNNEPSREPGGLFQMGLPTGFKERLIRRDYGDRLSVYFISRLDQIHFKVYAAVDSGPGRHLNDLLQLKPSPDEIEQAARWAVTHDVSDAFRTLLASMLRKLGFNDVAQRIQNAT
ncbi:MAG: DUF6036 family nucleotidyltransferase [bacterium]